MLVNWLLTRACNLKCHYCGIVRESKVYGPIKNELGPNKVKTILTLMDKKFVKNGIDLFHIFYGGEPFLFQGLEEVLIHCHELGHQYTVITNCTMIDKIYETAKKLPGGKFAGLSASMDPNLFNINNNTGDRYSKCSTANSLLKRNQDKCITDDMVIECTVDRNNILHLPVMLEYLQNQHPEVTVSITAYDPPKSQFYDFSYYEGVDAKEINNYLIQKNYKHAEEIFNRINSGEWSNIHMLNTGLVKNLWNHINADYKCHINKEWLNIRNPSKTLTIDADGKFRLCLRIRGTVTPSCDVENILSMDVDNISKKLHSSLSADYQKYCQGCNWTCPMMDQFTEDFENDVSHWKKRIK